MRIQTFNCLFISQLFHCLVLAVDERLVLFLRFGRFGLALAVLFEEFYFEFGHLLDFKGLLFGLLLQLLNLFLV